MVTLMWHPMDSIRLLTVVWETQMASILYVSLTIHLSHHTSSLSNSILNSLCSITRMPHIHTLSE